MARASGGPQTTDTAPSATRPRRRRARRGKAAKLAREMEILRGERRIAAGEGLAEYADRLTARLDALNVDLRTFLLQQDHAAHRKLAKALGISLGQLAEIARRRTRTAPPVPQEKLGRGTLR